MTVELISFIIKILKEIFNSLKTYSLQVIELPKNCKFFTGAKFWNFASTWKMGSAENFSKIIERLS